MATALIILSLAAAIVVCAAFAAGYVVAARRYRWLLTQAGMLLDEILEEVRGARGLGT